MSIVSRMSEHQKETKEASIYDPKAYFFLWVGFRNGGKVQLYSRYKQDKAGLTWKDEYNRMINLVLRYRREAKTMVIYRNNKEGRKQTDPDFDKFPENTMLAKVVMQDNGPSISVNTTIAKGHQEMFIKDLSQLSTISVNVL